MIQYLGPEEENGNRMMTFVPITIGRFYEPQLNFRMAVQASSELILGPCTKYLQGPFQPRIEIHVVVAKERSRFAKK